MSKVWTFELGRVLVALHVEQEQNYQYDGDDEDGETQAKLDAGEYVAFWSRVTVAVDGVEIGSDSLGGSVYEFGKESEFWTAHRDPDPENRNTLAMKARNRCICHYFPGMVCEAIRAARETLKRRIAA